MWRHFWRKALGPRRALVPVKRGACDGCAAHKQQAGGRARQRTAELRRQTQVRVRRVCFAHLLCIADTAVEATDENVFSVLPTRIAGNEGWLRGALEGPGQQQAAIRALTWYRAAGQGSKSSKAKGTEQGLAQKGAGKQTGLSCHASTCVVLAVSERAGSSALGLSEK